MSSTAATSERVVIDAADLWQHFDRQADLLRMDSRAHLDRRRRRALYIDHLLLAPVAIACGVYSGATASGVVVYLAVMLAYFFVCESLTGQSLGKRITGLRVVRLDGRPLGVAAVAARSLLLLVDTQALCLVGYVTMVLSGRRQRLGDLLAGTVVAEAETFPHRPAHERFRGPILAGYPLAWIGCAAFAAMAFTRGDAEARYLAEVNTRCAQAAAILRSGAASDVAVQAVNLEAALATVPPPAEREDLHRRLLAYEHGIYSDLRRADRDLHASADPQGAAVRIQARLERRNAQAAASLRGHGFDACL